PDFQQWLHIPAIEFLQEGLRYIVLGWQASHHDGGKVLNAGVDVMRTFVFQVATFLIVATAAFSQKAVVPPSSNDVSQKDEQQIWQLESEMLKGEMNSDPAVFERILADDCLNLPAGPDLTKAKLVEGVRKSQGQAPPYIAHLEDMHVYTLGDIAVAI